MTIDWNKEVFNHRSFFQLYRDSIRISSSVKNRIRSIILFWATTLLGSISFYMDWGLVTDKSLVSSIDLLTSFGITYTTTILGFLVAGFSIFSTMSKPELFRMLIILRYNKDDRYNTFQFIFFNFMYVFWNYVIILLFCVLLISVSSEKSMFQPAVVLGRNSCPVLFSYTMLIANSLMFSLLTYMVLLLKSFIWNLYQSILLCIASDSM